MALPINPVANSEKFTVLTRNKAIRNKPKKLSLAPCHLRLGFNVCRNRLIWFIGFQLDYCNFYETLFLVTFSSFCPVQRTVKSFGQGVAGNLFVKADYLTLEGGTISASTPLGEGGNVTLQVDDVLRLDNNSKISATATGEANGGNIDIDADTIVAFPNGNNDIVASAEKGNGGNINIKTEGIFGLKENPSTPENQTNDIDASSEFGFSGNVFINNPDVNPTKGIEQSPESVVEPDETVSQACSGSDDIAKENSFTIIGRGGMPESPTEPLKSTLLAGGTRIGEPRGGEAEKPRGGEASISLKEGKKTFSSDEVTPARGMTLNEKGQVVLTAYPTPNATASRSATNSINCSPKRQARANTNYIFPDNFLSGTN